MGSADSEEIMKILVANVGSTSLKFKLYDMPGEQELFTSKVERVGDRENAIFSFSNPGRGISVRKENQDISSYTVGIKMFLDALCGSDTGCIRSTDEIGAIGFKTVLSKGFYGVHELTGEVLQGMRDYLFIAPVHNSAYLEAIERFKEILPAVPMIGAFETAFHTTVPSERSMYSVPYEWYEKYGIKKYGYHGASHSYIADEAPKLCRADRLISCHLGGSCSICAIENGQSVDTSFGFSLQTGVMHANRCGDIDPYVVPFLQSEGLSNEEIMSGLEKTGGLLGISGVGNDYRFVLDAADAGNERAGLAIKMFETGIIRYIGMFYAELGGLDCLAFTGGIGENSVRLRENICTALAHLGMELDAGKNSSVKSGIVSASSSKVSVVVIPANEELGIARKTFEKISEQL